MSLINPRAKQAKCAVAVVLVCFLLPVVRSWSGGFSSGSEAVAAAGRVFFSTYLGGQDTQASGIALDSSGNAYITGVTRSASFPLFPATSNPGAALPSVFVTKLNPLTGSIVYSVLVAGTAEASVAGIAVDGQGSAYIAGTTFTRDFPTTLGAFQPAFAAGASQSVYIMKLDPSASSVVYSTLLGGGGIQAATSIAVDGHGKAYVTGTTNSRDFPVTPGSFQSDRGSAFVAKINETGSALDYSTLFGGNGPDSPAAITVDLSGAAYITGSAHSLDFPTTSGAFLATKAAPAAADNPFVMKLNPEGSGLVYSTFLGGSDGSHNRANAIAVASDGSAVVAGSTNSSDFTAVNALFGCPRGGDLLKTVDGAVTFSRSENGLPISGLSALAADPQKRTVAYAAFAGDPPGLFKTTTSGKTWTRLGDFGPAVAGCSAIAIDPQRTSTLYAGVSKQIDGVSVGAVLKSVNGGISWLDTGLNQPGLVVSALVVDPRNPSVIYAGFAGGSDGHTGGTYRSRDGGATWDLLRAGMPPGDCLALELQPGQSTVVYAGTSKGLFQSRDGGDNWTTLIDAPICSLAIDPDQPMTLYAGVLPNASASSLEGRGNPRKRIGQGGEATGLIKSVDGGANWKLINKGLRFADIVPNRILIDGNDSSLIYLASSDGLFVSPNSGRRWTATDVSGFPVRALAQSGDGTLYAQGSASSDAFVTKLDASGGVLYSTYIGGLGEDQGQGIALDSAGNAYLAGTTRSRNLPTTGKALQPQLGGGTDVFVVEISASGKRILYGSYFGGSGEDLLGQTSGGGIAVDAAGNIYLAGTTQSTDLPTVNAFQANLNGIANFENPPRNAFVAKLAHASKGQ